MSPDEERALRERAAQIADSDPPARLALFLGWMFILVAWKQIRCWAWITVAAWAMACFVIGHPTGFQAPYDWHVWATMFVPATLGAGIELHWLRIRRANGRTPREPPLDPPKP